MIVSRIEYLLNFQVRLDDAFVQSVNVGWRHWRDIKKVYGISVVKLSYECILAVHMGSLKHPSYALGQPEEKRAMLQSNQGC